jgi:2'-hydroxyisoflavone reductase
MKILIMGGTRFVGKAMAEELLDAGHEITLFHRGQTNPELFPEAEHILADRLGTIEELKEAVGARSWDAVIDTSAYVPRAVSTLLKALDGRIGRYLLISSISVYRENLEPGLTEMSPLQILDDPETEEINGETYGGLKVLCERAAEELLASEKLLILRPGFIVGPGDYTLRWPYWLKRVASGGPMIAPGPDDLPTQFIDARDLAAFARSTLEGGLSGIYNVTGPWPALSWRHVLETMREVTGSDAQFVWHDLEADLDNFDPAGFPMVAPGPGGRAMMQADISLAEKVGLVRRPLSETVKDTLKWIQNYNPDFSSGPGLSAQREHELLSMTED